jgi:hypothetical protein
MALLHNLSWRRAGFIVLIVLATTMLAIVAVVMLRDDPLLAEEDVFPDGIVLPLKRPDIVFPESVRTADLSLNRFVDRFARVCMEGKYSDLRLLLSTRSGTPLVARRFESMFAALKQVHILALQEVPAVRGIEGPAYVLAADYVLEDFAATKGRSTEQVRLAIAKENGVWRIGPIPRDLLAALEAHNAAISAASTTSPADGDAAVSAGPPRAGANKPVSITRD